MCLSLGVVPLALSVSFTHDRLHLLASLSAAMDTALAWLSHTPLGLKLVPPLARVYAVLLRAALELTAQAASLLLSALCSVWRGVAPWHLPLAILAASLLLLRPRLLFATAAAAIRAATVHLALCAHLARRVLQAQCQLLASLARLFAGWKHNPLRQRTDSYECDHAELLIAAMLFALCLLTLPTTAVFAAVLIAVSLFATSRAWRLPDLTPLSTSWTLSELQFCCGR